MSKIDIVMAEFKAYLERRRLAKTKHIPYFVNWVRQFLSFAKEHRGKTFDEVYAMFGESLGKDSQINEWQIRQALDAVRIYGYQFREISLSSQSPDTELACLDTVLSGSLGPYEGKSMMCKYLWD